MAETFTDDNGQRYVKVKGEWKPTALGDITLSPFGMDTGIPLPDSVEAGLINAGATFEKAGDALSDLFGIGSQDQRTQNYQDRQNLDAVKAEAPVSSFIGGIAPNIAAAPLAGTALLPNLAMAGVEGFLDYDPNQGAIARTAKGVAFGGLGYGVGHYASKVGKGVRNLIDKANMPDITPEAQKVLSRGGFVSLADKFGSDAGRTFEAGASKNPLMRAAFAAGDEQNQTVVNKAAAKAIGLTDDMLPGGKLTDNVLEGRQAQLEDAFENMIEAGSKGNDIGIGEKIAADVVEIMKPKLTSTKDNPMFKRLSKGTMQAGDYQGIRSKLTGRLTKAFDNKDLADADTIGQTIDALDNSMGEILSPDDMAKFARARQDWRNLIVLRKHNVVNAAGDANLRSTSRAFKSEYGSSFSNPNLKRSQINDETFDLFGTLKDFTNNNVRPIVGDSGTGGANIANELQNDVIAAGLGDQTALAKLIGKVGLGKAMNLIQGSQSEGAGRFIHGFTQGAGGILPNLGARAGGAGLIEEQFDE